MKPSPPPTRAQQVLVVLLLITGSWLGLHASLPGTSIGILWPPSGLALGFALRWDRRIYPALAAGALGSTLLVQMLLNPGCVVRTPGIFTAIVSLTALHTFLSPLVAAFLVRRQSRPGPFGLRQALSLFTWGGLVGQVPSALAGVGTFWLTGILQGPQVPRSAFVWWASNVTSVGLLAVWMAALQHGDLPSRLLIKGRPLRIFLGVALGTALSFFLPGWLSLPDIHLELLVVFPVLMSAFALGVSGAATAALHCATVTLAGTLLGYGAFAHSPSFTTLLSLQVYLLTVMGASLALGDTRWRWKRAQADLETSESWFREVFQGVHDAVVVLVRDAAGGLVVERANASAHAMLGQLAPRIPLEALPLASGPLEALRLPETLSLLDAGSLIQETWQLQVPEGQGPWVEGTLQSLVLGGRRCLLVTLRDITDRKAAEAEGERLRGQLLQAQKLEAVGLMTAGIAHDFNNLLAALQGYSDLLASDPTLQPEELAVRLQEIVKRGSSFTRALLAFSRPTGSEQHLVDLNLLVSDALPLLRRLAGSTIALSFQPSEGTAFLEANPGQLDQILVNLVANARDAMPHGGRLDLAVQLSGEGWVVLQVRDSGTGMDEPTQARIFDPFFTTKGAGRGTGLGLATIADIVKGHFGTIQVASAPGEGTTFRLRFPKRV